jgi:hypothetical protein
VADLGPQGLHGGGLTEDRRGVVHRHKDAGEEICQQEDESQIQRGFATVPVPLHL